MAKSPRIKPPLEIDEEIKKKILENLERYRKLEEERKKVHPKCTCCPIHGPQKYGINISWQNMTQDVYF